MVSQHTHPQLQALQARIVELEQENDRLRRQLAQLQTEPARSPGLEERGEAERAAVRAAGDRGGMGVGLPQAAAERQDVPLPQRIGPVIGPKAGPVLQTALDKTRGPVLAIDAVAGVGPAIAPEPGQAAVAKPAVLAKGAEEIALEQRQAAQQQTAAVEHANRGPQQRDRLLSAVAQITRDLLNAEDIDAAIPVALRTVAEASNIHRILLLLERRDPVTRRMQHYAVHKWVAPGFIDPGLSITDSEDFALINQTLRQGKSHWYVISDLPETPRLAFQMLGIQSSGSAPVFVEGQYIGCVAFDDCITPRHWMPQEIDALVAAAESIGAALYRKRLTDRLVEERARAAQARIIEYAKANAVLRQTAAQLVEQQNLDHFLESVLLAIAQQTGAANSMIFLYNGQLDVFFTHSVVQDGRLVDLEADPRFALWRSAIPATIIQAWTPTQRSGYLWLDVESEVEQLWSESVRWHRWMQHRLLLFVLLQVGNEPVGVVRLCFHEVVHLPVERLELTRTLAHQAALAIHLTQLAEDAKQAALVEAQRQAAQERIAHLAKTKQTLKQTLDTLVNEPELDRFLGHVLKAIADYFEAPMVEYWRYQGDTAYPQLMTVNGQICTPAELAHPCLDGFFVPPAQIFGEPLTQRRRHFIIDDYSHSPFIPQPLADFYLRRGGHQELNVPMILGDKTIGALIVRTSAGHRFTDEQIELAHALAHQASLAIQITQLAEAAKQTAIAREQERAAQERAAELAKANEALRSCLDRLAGEPDLDSFLEHILSEIVIQLNAQGLALFHYDASTHTLAMASPFTSIHSSTSAIDPEELKVFTKPIAADITPYWQTLLQSRSPLMLDARNSAHLHLFWPGTRDWHLRWNQPISLGVPMLLGDEALGFLGLAFEGEIDLTPEQLSLAQALTHQATLAIQLMRLAEQAKQAALAKLSEGIARQQLAVLAAANDALKQSLDVLLTDPDLERFLGHILSVIARQLDAPLTEYWFHCQGIAYIGMMCWNDRLYQRQDIARLYSQHPGISGCPLSADGSRREPLPQRQQCFMIADCRTRPYMQSVTWSVLHDLHREITLPMVMGDSSIGAILVRLPDDQQLDEPQIELARALTHQATLAIEFTRLAEVAKQEAKQAVILEERNRIASEIHDTLAQTLTGISIRADVARRIVAQNPTAAQPILSEISELAQTGIIEARQSVWALYSPASEENDLAQQLAQSAEQMTRNTAIQVELHLTGTPYALPSHISQNLLRIGQEAITNTLKHAQARAISIELTYTENTVRLTVRDDGQGFELPAVSARAGFGLVGMHQRAKHINAALSITTQAGYGTEIMIDVFHISSNPSTDTARQNRDRLTATEVQPVDSEHSDRKAPLD